MAVKRPARPCKSPIQKGFHRKTLRALKRPKTADRVDEQPLEGRHECAWGGNPLTDYNSDVVLNAVPEDKLTDLG